MCDDVNVAGNQAPTLVKYDHPKLDTYKAIHPIIPRPPAPPPPGPLEKSKTNWTIQTVCFQILSQLETEDVLNAILPPKEWQDEGRKWKQKVSSVPATKADVVHLMHLLDTRMKERGARETGICPVRRDLYSQCFDELIRQVTIVCAERGLLLVQIRDELKLTMSQYESLYISATAYSMRRVLQNELERLDLEARMEQLQQEYGDLMREKRSLDKELERTVREQEGLGKREQEARANELDNLKKLNTELKRQLETCVAFKKRAVAKQDDD